jgi:hypothetical protein
MYKTINDIIIVGIILKLLLNYDKLQAIFKIEVPTTRLNCVNN